MLVALLAAYLSFMAFFGTGGDGRFGELMTRYAGDQIEATIQEKDRRKAALRGLDQVNDHLNAFNRQVSGDLKALEKLILDYDSKPEDFDRLFADALANNQKLEEKLWDARQAMLGHIEAGEWQTIMKGAETEQKKQAAPKAE